MFSTVNLIVGVIAGAIGLGYFVYGKKQGELVFLVSGIGLMVYPYLLSSGILLVVAGLALAALPFILKTS